MRVDSGQKVVIAGGNGFLGRMLSRWFVQAGWRVTVLTRRPAQFEAGITQLTWDGKTPGPWRHGLEQATAVINLAGRSVNCRYNARNREQILNSRLDSTFALASAIAGCDQPPEVWLNSSTATIYQHSFDRAMDEDTGVIAGTPAAHDQFSVDVAQAWEHALFAADVPSITRRVAMRAAMVLGQEAGGVYRVLRRLARLGLGGAMGSGRQYVSWIHEQDFCRAVQWLIDHPELTGPVNLAAPFPLTNREMMRRLRWACGMRWGLPASESMLQLGAVVLRTEPELVLKSRRVVPRRLTDSGFCFEYPEFAAAVDEIETRLRSSRPRKPQQANVPALTNA